MNENTTVEFEVFGDLALFANPVYSCGSEHYTYKLPTPGALKGVLDNIYFKPTFFWVVDKIRVMNKMDTTVLNRTILSMKGTDRATYTYLKNVRYQVQAHLEWNMQRPHLAQDRKLDKHMTIFKRALMHGGRRPIFLGMSDCVAYVKPCTFGEGVGYYDNSGEVEFDPMYHSYTYPSEVSVDDKVYGDGNMYVNMYVPVMQNGVIDVPAAKECTARRFVREWTKKELEDSLNLPHKPVNLVDEDEVACGFGEVEVNG